MSNDMFENSSGGDSTGNKQPTALDKKRANAAANAKNLRTAADVAVASGHPIAVGIGEGVKVADKLTFGKSTDMLGKIAEKEFRRTPGGPLAQKASNKLSDSGISDAIGKAVSLKNGQMPTENGQMPTKKGDKKKNSETDLTKGKKSKKTDDGTSGKGNTDIDESFVSKGLMLKILLFCACFCFVMVFLIAVVSTVYESRLGAVIMGNLTASDKSLLDGVIDEIETGQGNDVGMGNVNMSVYYKRIEALGNVFSSEFKCEKEDCSDRPEVRYYLKVADIALRYKNKYHVNLDWVLLNATIMYSDVDEEATMKRALNDYDLDAVEDYDKLMNLDWDYDYKNISGYTYLSPDDFRYDLQILAKNMVTKTTTQTCSKKEKDEDGNETTVVTKTQTDKDIEDQYLKSGQEYYLKCDSGEEYSISSKYALDLDKYDEFLLEYIERKYYMPSLGGNISSGNAYYNCVSQQFTKYDLTEDQLEQIASLAYHEQGTAKGAAAEASLMANLFELKGSSYGTGADGLYNYVRNSGWFANSESNMDSKDASPEIIAAVRSVLVDGKRTLPGYIDEHDWINDLSSVTNDGKEINKSDRSAYKQFTTIIKNKYGATYTFYSFPDTNSDPFGYTSEENREKIGDFHYNYDTGQPINCSASGDYFFPLPEGSVTCRSSAYGPRTHPITGEYSNHSGDDYPAAGGTPVYAIGDGVVSSSGTGCPIGDLYCNYGMGNYVVIQHENGIKSAYYHATDVYVSSGQTVKKGDVIMTVGTTGQSTGNHLHISIFKDGELVNPGDYIGALPMCY